MKNWLKVKFKNSVDTNTLFEESIMCYNVNAFRASLLFSYLGFLTHIKESIISSNKPSHIEQGRWDNILNKLFNEDLWEKRVYEELVNSSSSIFNFSENVRQQIKYWKDRRNDCAHYKENEINNTHVEMFWTFLKHNLVKISIVGSKQNLINKFKDFFDKTKTSPNKKIDNLIYEIEESLEIPELQEFFMTIESFQIIDETFVSDELKYEVFFKIYSLLFHNKRIINELNLFIKKQKHNFDLIFIAEFSQVINFIDYTPEEIREIWKKRIKNLNHNKYVVLVSLLRNSKIPNSELKEFFQELYFGFNQIGFNNLFLDDNEKNFLFSFPQLIDTIYEDIISNDKLSKSDYDYLNSKEEMITALFIYRNIDIEMINGLSGMVEKSINPYWLKKSLVDLFENDNEKVTDILKLSKETKVVKEFYNYFKIIPN
jgi:hypothetical protein